MATLKGSFRLKYSMLDFVVLHFPERANRIPAYVALHAQAAMARRGDLFSPYPLSGKDPGKDKVEDGDLMIHAAGGNAEDGDGSRVQRAEGSCPMLFALCSMPKYATRNIAPGSTAEP